MTKFIKVLATTALFVMAANSTALFAQSAEVPIHRASPSYYYVEVSEITLGVLRSSIAMKKSVNINFGKDAPTATAYKIADEKETGLVQFENVLGALNYLGALGWEVVSAYKRNNNNTGQIYYLLKIDASKYKPTAITRAIDEMLGELKLQDVE